MSPCDSKNKIQLNQGTATALASSAPSCCKEWHFRRVESRVNGNHGMGGVHAALTDAVAGSQLAVQLGSAVPAQHPSMQRGVQLALEVPV